MENPSPNPSNSQDIVLRQMLIEAFRRLSTSNKLKVIRTAQQLVRKELLGDGDSSSH